MSHSTVVRKINLKRISHVYYTHKDLEKAHQFYLDFGFSVSRKSEDDTTIYYRGYGTEPFVLCASKGTEDVFGGAGWVVESLEDLEIASDTLPGATKVLDLSAPGGGKTVTFHDNVDGFPFHLVYGQEAVEMTETFPELEYNFPTAKHRPVNKTQRFNKGPAPVHKLGHFGLCVTDYKAAHDFYTTHFNLKQSELVHDEAGNDIMTFLHLDRGSEKVDHHAFFFFQGPKYHVHHSSFEVHDVDIQMLGHTWLREKGYDNCWGVGRHVMGSQIFDYWYVFLENVNRLILIYCCRFDPSRFIMEHYVDGDLVNDETPINRTQASPDNLHVWGKPCFTRFDRYWLI
jgi:catechol 2,3-dioxygenase-like lactoylglutathione lyase family enzyme